MLDRLQEASRGGGETEASLAAACSNPSIASFWGSLPPRHPQTQAGPVDVGFGDRWCMMRSELFSGLVNKYII